MKRLSSACFAACLALGLTLSTVTTLALPTASQAQAPVDIPAPLEPFKDWVLRGDTNALCPMRESGSHCEWPGTLQLELDATGGRFTQRVWIDAFESYFHIPGAIGRWPLAVRVNGRQAPVIDLGGPAVRLVRGVSTIEGRFKWSALPERVEVARTTALVELRVLGEPVPFPKRDENGQLWLNGSLEGDTESEQLALSVSRKIEDGVPMLITTRIQLRVAGRAREINLGRVLLPGTIPLSLTSELPARLEEGGELRVQARAGTYRVEATARRLTSQDGSPDKLAYHRPNATWPEGETWVWQAHEALRQVELSGAPAVDASRTEIDGDWHGMPTFLLRDGVSLALTTVRRGEPTPPPNRLALRRELWLDLDGDQFTVRDQLHAAMHKDFRLDLVAGELGHVAVDGEDLLITKNGKHSGVELRKAEQWITAEWRTKAGGSLAAVGWSEDVQSLSTTLHLAPGYSLFAAKGVDSVSQSWLQDWDLYDFFFVLIIAIAALRLIGKRAALLALVTLVLCHQEADAPGAVWLGLLAWVALLRVLPSGAFRNIARLGYALTALTFALVALPFVAQQARFALYPQLDERGGAFDFSRGVKDEEASMPMPVAAPMPASAPAQKPAYGGDGKEAADEAERALIEQANSGNAGGAMADTLAGARGSNTFNYKSGALSKSALMQDPEASVQTGPGVPSWQWRGWHLGWSGPVDKNHSVELYLVTPTMQRVLAVLRVLTLFGLAFLVLAAASISRDKPESLRPRPMTPTASIAGVLIALLASIGCASTARADIPPQDMLEELHRRLVERPACAPNCVSLDQLDVSVANGTLTLTLHVHALDITTIALPGPAASWLPASVALDRVSGAPTARLEDGFLHVRVTPGVHVIEAKGPLPETDTLTLAVTDVPHRGRVQADGYKVDGVREDGQVEGTLQISRLLKNEDDVVLERAALPPFLQLTRRFELGPTWTVHNTLDRVSPTGTPVRVTIPLLPGESVMDAAVEVANGQLQASLGRDGSQLVWTSTLKPSDRITLNAAKNKPFTERWMVACGPIWHCEHEGIAPIQRIEDGVWRPSFWPWPGETLSVRVTRPESAGGQSMTIDSVKLDVTPGVRMQSATLDLSMRTSRGGSPAVELPKGARVQVLQVNGESRPIRLDHDKLTFTLGQGAQNVHIEWQAAIGMSAAQAMPRVVLDRPATNVSLTMRVPEDRWLLWATGPAWGPAVLFWGYFALVLVIAIALGRTRNTSFRTPLRGWEWLLLGIGLTQIEAVAALCVVLWFFAMAYRGRMPEQNRWPHNLLQLFLIGFTLAALSALYAAVHSGLVVQPEMQIAGAGSNGSVLNWYVDRVTHTLPSASILSAPLWVFRLPMLIWSLWLAASIVRWLPWAFGNFKEGGLWKRAPIKAAPAWAQVPPAPTPVTPAEPAAPASNEPPTTRS